MANYRKMYAILCGAIDDAIDELEKLEAAKVTAEKLKAALQAAEEIFIENP